MPSRLSATAPPHVHAFSTSYPHRKSAHINQQLWPFPRVIRHFYAGYPHFIPLDAHHFSPGYPQKTRSAQMDTAGQFHVI